MENPPQLISSINLYEQDIFNKELYPEVLEEKQTIPVLPDEDKIIEGGFKLFNGCVNIIKNKLKHSEYKPRLAEVKKKEPNSRKHFNEVITRLESLLSPLVEKSEDYDLKCFKLKVLNKIKLINDDIKQMEEYQEHCKNEQEILKNEMTVLNNQCQQLEESIQKFTEELNRLRVEKETYSSLLHFRGKGKIDLEEIIKYFKSLNGNAERIPNLWQFATNRGNTIRNEFKDVRLNQLIQMFYYFDENQFTAEQWLEMLTNLQKKE